METIKYYYSTLIVIHIKPAISLYALSGDHASTSVSLQALVYIKGAKKICLGKNCLFLPPIKMVRLGHVYNFIVH